MESAKRPEVLDEMGDMLLGKCNDCTGVSEMKQIDPKRARISMNESLKDTAGMAELKQIMISGTPDDMNSEDAQWVGYFDSCCKGNPGPSGAGWLWMLNGRIRAFGHTYVSDNCTNNEGEHTALIELLKSAPPTRLNITIRGDSKLVIMQVQGKWKCKAPHLQKFIDKSKSLLRPGMMLEHVPREQNTDADFLSNIAIKRPDRIVIGCNLEPGVGLRKHIHLVDSVNAAFSSESA